MNKLKIIVSTIISFGLINAIFAAKITNNIIGVGPKNAPINPVFCIQNGSQFTYALKSGETVDANQYSGSKYYVGGSLRFGGCSENDTYLGYVSFNVNDDTQTYSFQQYSPFKGVHIAYTDPAISQTGSITGKIQYTPILSNFTLLNKAPSQNNNWDFVGVNLSGLEFSKVIDPVVVPNLSAEDAADARSDLAEMQAFLQAGMNTVRVPISWGYLQLEGAGIGDLNLDYYNSYLKPLLETLTSAKVNTIVDLHAYMRYSVFGKEYSGCFGDAPCPDGTLIEDAKAYQDVWTKLYSLIKNNPNINQQYIMFDLMNEPVGVSGDNVFTIQVAIIKSLRAAGFNGYLLVEGNQWNGLHSWTTTSWEKDGKTYTNASLFTRDNFVRAGITDLSKILINVHQYFDNDFSGTKRTCLTDLTTTGVNGFNLQAFVDYLKENKMKAIVTEFSASANDPQNCSKALKDFLDYMKINTAKDKDYGFVGWTFWSAGHGWGDYDLRIKPNSYQMQQLQMYLQPIA